MTSPRTIIIPINDTIATDLATFAAAQGRDPVQVVRDLLVEWLEDQADIQAVERAIADGGPRYSLEEVRTMLDLDERPRP